MTVFFILFLLWVLVTLFGHVSWLLVGLVFQAVFGETEANRPPPHPQSHDDTAAALRVVDRLARNLQIAPREAHQLRHQITLLQRADLRGQSLHTGTPNRTASVPPEHGPDRTALPPKAAGTEKMAAAVPPKKRPPSARVPAAVLTAGAVAAPAAGPATGATAVPAAEAQHPESMPLENRATKAVPSTPKASLGQSLAEFLAEHNIRWGELIAGLLIVVCSIGLVVSLWSTITQLHRVIPSLIFLAGNAAIFGAGLYTLFRWRLPDTSRATLVIATLLVPLGILTGLSTGGDGESSVYLSDPITLVGILGVGAIYAVLIWQSSRALVGSKLAVPMTLVVAGPAAVLPLVPASIRMWSGTAGFVTYAASAVLAIATWRLSSIGLHHPRRNASRWMMIVGIGIFSLAVLCGYLAFMTRDLELGWLSLAVAAIPGITVFSMVSDRIGRKAPVASLAMAANVVVVFTVLAGIVVGLPAMRSMGWLWMWALSLAIPAAYAAMLVRNGLWSALAALPIGIATLVSSPAWWNGLAWNEITFWQRLFGGQPMVASLAIAAATFAAAGLIRVSPHRRVLLLCGTLWSLLSLANALVLSVLPVQWMGSVPEQVVPLLLGGGAVALLLLGRKVPIDRRQLTPLIYTLLFDFWFAMWRPLTWAPFAIDARLMMHALLATGVAGFLAAEIVPVARSRRRLLRQYASVFLGGSAVLACILLLLPQSDALTVRWCLITLPATLLCWTWIGLADRDETHLIVARFVLTGTAFVLGYHFFHQELFAADAWRNGAAVWHWSAVGWVLAAAVGIRNLALWGLRQPRVHSTLRFSPRWQRMTWYDPMRSTWDRDSWALMIQVSAAVSMAGGLLGIVLLVLSINVAGLPSVTTEWILSGGLLGIGCAVLSWLSVRDREHHSHWYVWRVLQFCATVIWVSWQIGLLSTDDPSRQLIMATTIGAVGCFALDLLRRRTPETDESALGTGLSTAVGLIGIGTASVTLLQGNWLNPILQGHLPERLPTLSVAGWWTLASLACLVMAYRNGSKRLAVVATVLLPAVVVLVMPLLRPDRFWQWGQAAGVTFAVLAVGWSALANYKRRLHGHWDAFSPAIDLSLVASVLVGGVTCLGAYFDVLVNRGVSDVWFNGVAWGASLSGLMLLLRWNRLASDRCQLPGDMLWTTGLVLLSAQAAATLQSLSASVISAQQSLAVLWTAIAFVSTSESYRLMAANPAVSRRNQWQAGWLVIAATLLCWAFGNSPWHFLVGVVACVGGGLVVSIRAIAASPLGQQPAKKTTFVLSRLLCGYVLVGGGILLIRWLDLMNLPENQLWTALLCWFAAWGIGWRLICPDVVQIGSTGDVGKRLLSDFAASLLLVTGLTIELVVMFSWRDFSTWENTATDFLFWVRLVVAVMTVASIAVSHRRRGLVELAIFTPGLLVTLIGLHLGIDREATPIAKTTIVALAISSTATLMVFASAAIAQSAAVLEQLWANIYLSRREPLGRGTSGLPPMKLTRGLVPLVVLVAAVSIGLSLAALILENANPIVPVTICAVAFAAIAAGELSEREGSERLRQLAVLTGLVAVSMWASCAVATGPLPALALTTRWFVAWVILAAVPVFVLPKILPEAVLRRWRSALKMGLGVCLGCALVALAATLIQEAMVRVAGETDQLVKPLYLALASVLAMISLLCTMGGILSGPGFSYRKSWNLTDQHRVILIVAAQAFGGLTWFHLFLCKSPLANLGLRAYWPYVVMALSFVSVGVTEWARRRDDEVLRKTLAQTALYLPLIPVIGFWLSGSWTTSLFGTSAGPAWTYIQGEVTYHALLICAAIYYGVISFLWKNRGTRLISVLIGNAALWVILVQTPNWDFLAHPQAWLIPPAVCVLALAHWHRESLGAEATSAIRYAATLVIYVTSTADMLVQGIGETLAGPIVLIVLALLGAGAGIALRVRPFLYLGTTFVFIGVVSMVWHAQQQIGEVWPWWVFGIGMGVLLLIGLMAIEKNKPKLRRLATSLQQWET